MSALGSHATQVPSPLKCPPTGGSSSIWHQTGLLTWNVEEQGSSLKRLLSSTSPAAWTISGSGMLVMLPRCCSYSQLGGNLRISRESLPRSSLQRLWPFQQLTWTPRQVRAPDQPTRVTGGNLARGSRQDLPQRLHVLSASQMAWAGGSIKTDRPSAMGVLFVEDTFGGSFTHLKKHPPTLFVNGGIPVHNLAGPIPASR